LDGVLTAAVVVVEFRVGRRLVAGDEGNGSDFVNCGDATLLPET